MTALRRTDFTLRRFLDSEASGGIVLMATAAAALLVANSPLAGSYFGALHAYVGPLSVQHWINDALMALFFLLVGLEIKREFLDGQLSTWRCRVLPGICALGGMAVPALIYVAINSGNPSATDTAFALGVLSLLGNRVPASMKIFLTALAIIDDLGAVLIIALFYTSELQLSALTGAAAVMAGPDRDEPFRNSLPAALHGPWCPAVGVRPQVRRSRNRNRGSTGHDHPAREEPGQGR